GRGRAAHHRAARCRRQRRGRGDGASSDLAADHRGAHRARAPRRRRMTLRTGLLILPTYEPARLAALAEMAEATGYDDFWLADERFFREVYAGLTLCALRTRRMRLGPCVTDPYSRHPALTAMATPPLACGVCGRRNLSLS